MKREKIIRVVILLISAFSLGLFVGLCYQTGWGADPITVFFAGLHNSFPVSLGFASVLTAIMMITIVFFIEKKQLGIGTVLTPVAVQMGIDLGIMVFPRITVIGWALFFLVIGFLGLGFSIAVNICCDMGRSSFDALVLSISNLTKKPYYFVRWFIDGSLLLMGWLLGGKVSFANVLAFFVIGRIVDVFVRIIRQNWLKELELVEK